MSDLADVLGNYGVGYTDPRLGMDAADSGTQHVLRLMGAQQAAKEREGPEALARLLTTWMPPAAAAHKAISNSNLPKAINYHNRLEQRDENPLVNWATKPFLSADLAVTVPGYARALRGEPSRGLADRLSSFYGRTLDRIPGPSPYGSMGELMANHTEDTAQILNYLNKMSSRAPKYGAIY